MALPKDKKDGVEYAIKTISQNPDIVSNLGPEMKVLAQPLRVPASCQSPAASQTALVR